MDKNSSFTSFPLKTSFVDHPSVMDINGDGFADIIGFQFNGNDVILYCMKGSSNTLFVDCKSNFIDFPEIVKPSNYFGLIFADMNGDSFTEIVFGLEGTNGIKLSIWKVYPKLANFY